MNLALVGLDQNVNLVQGKFFNPNLEDLQKVAFPNPANPEDIAWVDRNLNLWNDVYVSGHQLRKSSPDILYTRGMAMMLLHLPNIAAQFKKVNGAIYEVLLVDSMPRLLTPLVYASRSSRAFDEIQSRETPQETAQWAEMPKSFMPSFLSVQG